MLTAAQRKALNNATDKGLIRFVDGRRGFRRAAWERMMNRLCADDYATPYLDGDYYITEKGREALGLKD